MLQHSKQFSPNSPSQDGWGLFTDKVNMKEKIQSNVWKLQHMISQFEFDEIIAGRFDVAKDRNGIKVIFHRQVIGT